MSRELLPRARCVNSDIFAERVYLVKFEQHQLELITVKLGHGSCGPSSWAKSVNLVNLKGGKRFRGQGIL